MTNENQNENENKTNEQPKPFKVWEQFGMTVE